jgi:hypothetical protein
MIDINLKISVLTGTQLGSMMTLLVLLIRTMDFWIRTRDLVLRIRRPRSARNIYGITTLLSTVPIGSDAGLAF